MRLENKVALISGGARGMGAVEAHMFATEGARVVIGDVLEDEGRQTEASVNEAGGECVFVRLDVTSESDWNAAVAAAVSRFGKLDILVNNAGISSTGGIEDLTVEEWERTLDINTKGVFLGTKAAIPEMRKAGGGSIVNISSGAGIAPAPGTSGAYAASKGAVRILSKSTAVQYARENIRCNSVHPRPDRDADAALRPWFRCGAQRDCRSSATWTHRQARGDRIRRPVPSLRRVLVRHWLGTGHRRRQNRPVRGTAPSLSDEGAALGLQRID